MLIGVWTESIGDNMKENSYPAEKVYSKNDFYKNANQDAEEKEVAYQMANIRGMGNKSIFKLLEYAGNIKKALYLPEKEVYEVLDMRNANAFLRGREQKTLITAERLKREQGIDFVPFISPRYPNRLRNIPEPPFALYVKGELPEETKPSVAVIGARACSEYGKTVAGFFGRQLGNEGVQIISGMARGIDGIAQRGALESKGKTFAVLGCGVDVCYPRENNDLYVRLQEQGGVISEYAPGTEAQSKLFPPRNRIISGLSDLILVIEARKRSGTYITVLQALEQGKEVYAVPGRITDSLSDGCNYLLSQGAGVAISPESIVEELSKRYTMHFTQDKIKRGEKQTERITENHIKTDKDNGQEKQENLILSILDITPIALEELYEKVKDKSQIDMPNLMLILTKLQITGKVEGSGSYYRLTCAL